MKDLILLQEEKIKKVLKHLLVSKSDQDRLIKLFQDAKLEKELLHISSYESAEFILRRVKEWISHGNHAAIWISHSSALTRKIDAEPYRLGVKAEARHG